MLPGQGPGPRNPQIPVGNALFPVVNRLMKILLSAVSFLFLLPTPGSADISRSAFRHLTELCTLEKESSRWLDLNWEIDLWKARQRAAKEGKPIFLWEMDGHPLGCT